MICPFPDLIKLYDMSVTGVIHVGAHLGWEYKYYAQARVRNLVMVEPNPRNYASMCRTVDKHTVSFNVALGNKEDWVDYWVEDCNAGQSNSVLRPLRHLEICPNIKFDGTIRVPMTKLDNLVIDRTKYNFLNMDTQGYELEILKGGVEVLKGVDYVYTEVNAKDVYENCATEDEVTSFLREAGFHLVKLWWDARYWGDALYSREELKGG